ncbi:MAG: transglutaminase domain-containing protein [Butyricicoccaceae bacterium]
MRKISVKEEVYPLKKLRRSAALLLALLVLLPQAAFAAPLSFTDELETARAFADRLADGQTDMQISVPSRFDFTLCYRYLCMLYRDAYVFEYIPTPANAYIKVVYNDAEKHAAAEAEADRLAAELLREEMTDQEKYRAIHEYLLDHCVYDMHAALNQSVETGDAFSAYGALCGGQAVCDGISAAFAMICRSAGLPCLYVASTEMNHSWNIVLLQGEVRYIDTTFDLTGGTRDRYFLLTEQALAADHQWDRELVRSVTDTVWDMRFISAYILNRVGGLFRGSDKGWELDRCPTRAEAAIMLVRFLGMEQEALEAYGQLHMPFTDVNPNHAPYIAALYAMGLTRGTSPTTFSPNTDVTARDYMTFMLRALGYNEAEGDFAWESALQDALDLGVLDRAAFAELQGGTFDRGMMAYASLQTLLADDAGGTPLYQRLADSQVIDAKKLKEFLK